MDLKLGHPSSTSASALVSQLEKASIANLIDECIAASLGHIDKLRLRVEDTSSKVLVTGDLNAGKSTFVNAILGRQVMPVDQQPCTTAFCEVHDAAENGGREEVHVIKDSSLHRWSMLIDFNYFLMLTISARSTTLAQVIPAPRYDCVLVGNNSDGFMIVYLRRFFLTFFYLKSA